MIRFFVPLLCFFYLLMCPTNSEIQTGLIINVQFTLFFPCHALFWLHVFFSSFFVMYSSAACIWPSKLLNRHVIKKWIALKCVGLLMNVDSLKISDIVRFIFVVLKWAPFVYIYIYIYIYVPIYGIEHKTFSDYSSSSFPLRGHRKYIFFYLYISSSLLL